MQMSLRVGIIAACLLLAVFVLRLVLKDKLQLKYSLLWLVCALFPQPLYVISSFFGFATLSNFIFVVGFLFLLCIVLSLGCLSSKQATAIANLSQRIALLEKEIESIREE